MNYDTPSEVHSNLSHDLPVNTGNIPLPVGQLR